MAGITLLEAAKRGGLTDHERAVTKVYADSTDILRAIPFKTIKTAGYTYSQENTLPGVAFRGINASWTPSAGVINPLTEHLTISGGEVDVDNFLVDRMGNGIRADEEYAKVKHMAHLWAYKFIKGDSTSTNAEFDGLQTRLTGNQKISMGSTSGGVVLSLAKLDELIDAVVEPTHLIMSRALRRLLNTASRTAAVGGNINFEPDEFGRKVMHYGELPILTADNLDEYYTTLGFNEADEGAGGTACTSVYCVSFKPGHLEGLHGGTPIVSDLGQISGSPVHRTRIEWFTSLLLRHPKAAARLWSIKTGTVTA